VKVLIVGAGGQVGRALVAAPPAGAELVAAGHQELDISNAAEVQRHVAEIGPAVIINAAAYTAVDNAEREPDAAKRVNEIGPLNLARAARALSGCRMLHVSTDFVFDGLSPEAYRPDARTGPLGVYGQTKLDGERHVLATLGERAVVVRTSWVYDASGRNFVRTMLRLMNERRAVRVVADQIGTPTAAHSVAEVLWRFAEHAECSGTFHWSDAGVASWYDFAVAIAEEGAALGLVPPDVEVTPIATEEYPTPARRPPFSVLDRRATVAAVGARPVHWRQHLRRVLREMVRA
jgi:dTDP-4-dehydrorhamnose reductase